MFLHEVTAFSQISDMRFLAKYMNLEVIFCLAIALAHCWNRPCSLDSQVGL